MRLKSFTANSMREAMQMIRDTLGEDAVIIATREENGGRTVRVTAAVDKDLSPPARMDREKDRSRAPHPPSFESEMKPFDLSTPRDDWQYDDDDDSATVVEEVTDVMLRHAVPENVLDQVVSAVNIMGLDDSRNALFAALQNLFEFRPLPMKTMGKPLILVGPPGAGKTLAAAKIAARGALAGLRVATITTDTIRAGGVEQLEAFTRILKINLKKASDSKELKACLQSCAGADQVIIDTAGVNPFNPESVKLLARLIHTAEMEPVLVLPAGMDADESGEIGRVFSMIGARLLLPTRVDVARRLGSLLAAAHDGGLSFSEVSNTAKVADGLAPLSAKRLTQLLMPRAGDASMTQARKAG